MGPEKIRRHSDAPRYLETTKEVLNEGPSIGADRHITVELSKVGLRYLSPVFTDVLLPQVELQEGTGRTEVKWMQNPVGLVPHAAHLGESPNRYLGGEVRPLGTALVMQGDSFDPSKDDVLGNLHTQAPEA